MDPREALRRYLEQRRDLGEQELVLDGMDVDEVLRIVGAIRGGAPATGAKGAGDASGPATPVRQPERRRGADAVEPPSGPGGEGRPGAPARDDRPATGGAAPDFDWRSALRAAGGAPVGPPAQPRAPREARVPEERLPEERVPEAPAAAGTAGAGANADPGSGDDMAARKTTKAAREAKPSVADADIERGTGRRTAPAPASPADLPAWLKGFDAPTGLVVGGASTELIEPDFAKLRTLDDVARTVEKCTRCPLYKTATHAVPGEGNPNADLVCVGEAPGQQEDETGRPFVGASGQLLTKILAAIKLSRDEVFICNVLKHRPPGNRNPAPDEVEACSPYLLRQLELLKPRVIVTFGTFAAQTLLRTKTPIGKLREQVHLYHGIPLVVTYHPAALLRNPAWKRPTWNDVQLARRILDRATSA